MKMTKEEQLRAISDAGVVAVLRTSSADELINICTAMAEGGIMGVEITMTSPGALEAIRGSSQARRQGHHRRRLRVDPETARACILAGADFIVSPVFNPAWWSSAAGTAR